MTIKKYRVAIRCSFELKAGDRRVIQLYQGVGREFCTSVCIRELPYSSFKSDVGRVVDHYEELNLLGIDEKGKCKRSVFANMQ